VSDNPSKSPRRLLIVEDEPRFAAFGREAAQGIGMQVDMAVNGEAAKAVFLRFDPDVIVLDVVMSVMDGVEFVQWLAPQGCRARLVLVTGYNPHYGRLAERLGQAKGIGSVTVLTKPVRLHQLLAAIDEKAAGA
jgi:CheY-like chemotaxis protein